MNSSSTHSRLPVHPLAEPRPTSSQLTNGLAIGGGAGVLVALCSLLGTGGWYALLVKPLWAPPGWIFAPVQLVVGLLVGVALAHLWASNAAPARKRVVLAWFWAQLGLGVLWNFCFFGAHSPAWGYTAIMVWWCAVVALIWTGSRLSRTAFRMLVPLFLWVTFASSLNFAILSFNVLRQESAAMDADPRNSNSPAEPPIIIKRR